MASPQSDIIKTLYSSWSAAAKDNPDRSLEEMRAQFEHWGDITGEPGGVDYIEVDAGGVQAMWAIPKGAAADRVLLCCHGGGYVVGSMFTHRKRFGHIAKACDARALIIDYRRAPEYPHPAQVEDAVKAYQWLLREGFDPAHIATTGDSAGGALCTTVLLALRDQGVQLPAAALPMSPWYDMEISGESIRLNAHLDCIAKEETVRGMAESYLGETSPKEPLANPLYADLQGLPPIYIQVGSHEALLDDSTRFEARARSAGVDVRLDVFEEMQHVFQFLAGTAPEADEAVQRMADWLRPRIGLA